MNENINLAEILKDAPKGTHLYSSIFGNVTFESIIDNGNTPIEVHTNYGKDYFFKDGRYKWRGECVLFPSKDNRDWLTFKTPKHFEPFQKVLIKRYRLTGPAIWGAAYYSHYINNAHYTTTGKAVGNDDIIPYRGNENKLGKPVEIK